MMWTSRELVSVCAFAVAMLLFTLAEMILEEYKFSRTEEVLVRAVTYGLVGVALWLAIISGASAHDHGHPELNSWLSTLRSDAGLCCDGSDVEYLDDPMWRMEKGHYAVFLGRAWVAIPDGRVVQQPNRLKMAVVWPIYHDGMPTEARCFMPGGLG